VKTLILESTEKNSNFKKRKGKFHRRERGARRDEYSISKSQEKESPLSLSSSHPGIVKRNISLSRWRERGVRESLFHAIMTARADPRELRKSPLAPP
jgi:hypothetical protein